MSSDPVQKEYEFISRMLQKSLQDTNTRFCDQCGEYSPGFTVSKAIARLDPDILVYAAFTTGTGLECVGTWRLEMKQSPVNKLLNGLMEN